MEDLSWAQVAGFRLGRHHLDRRAPLSELAVVVGDVCGVQAQLMSAAELALWARVEGLAREDVKVALEEKRSLVKTWCMRGAAHLLAAMDLPVYVGGLWRSGLRREWDWVARHGVSRADAEAMVEAVVEALTDGEALTRKELTERVVARVGAKAKRWVEHSWGGIVKQACLLGLVVFGPSRGQEITFVKRDRWLPRLKDMPEEKAEERLLQRYLHGYGPASLADFAAWSGLTVGYAEPVRERLGGEVVEVKVEGKARLLLLREDVEELQKAAVDEDAECVRLLPSFDCYMLGHKDKSHIVDAANYKRVYRKAGWLSPVVLVNGRAEGVWNSKKKGKGLQITIQPFKKISKSVKEGIEIETKNLACFYATTGEVVFVK